MEPPSPSRANAPRQQKGFTIIELVLVISILSIIMGITYSSLSQILRTKQVLDDERDARAVLNAVLLRFSREIGGAQRDYPLLIAILNTGTGGWKNRFVIGENKSIGQEKRGDTLYLINERVSLRGGSTPLIQVGYSVEEDPNLPGTFILFREEVPYRRPPEKAYEKAIKTPLSTGVQNLKFRFYDEKTKKWWDDWGTGNRTDLPSMIEYSIAIKTASGSTESFTGAVPLSSS